MVNATQPCIEPTTARNAGLLEVVLEKPLEDPTTCSSEPLDRGADLREQIRIADEPLASQQFLERLRRGHDLTVFETRPLEETLDRPPV